MSETKKSRKTKVLAGRTVEVHYVGTLEDGTEFDSSRNRGETLSFEVGGGQMIAGFDAGVVGMKVGETKNITLEPSEAYGEPSPEAIQVFSKDAFPEGAELTEGVQVVGQNEDGQQMVATIDKVSEDSVTLDFNHPLSGKRPNFAVEVISVN